jgi:peptidoglycan/xylan/chitin deacetylase (PgdA/CDA1 family)
VLGTAILLAAAAVVVLAVLAYQPRWLMDALQRRHPVVFRFAGAERAVALTIDDGPHPTLTPRILEVLARHDARATFFVLGRNARRHPELLRRMREAGHEIGNHFVTDFPGILLPAARFEAQLAEAGRILADAGPVTGAEPVRWCRPGSGWFNARMLRTIGKHGYGCCLASVYPHDVHVRWPRLVAWYVLRRTRPGDILVLHEGKDGRRGILDVLRTVLPALKERGYRVTTVSELERLADRRSGRRT